MVGETLKNEVYGLYGHLYTIISSFSLIAVGKTLSCQVRQRLFIFLILFKPTMHAFIKDDEHSIEMWL